MSALVISGPTAAGKTGVAVEIALRWDAVVLSADAMQVFRGMDIGTGKATEEERRGVPHYGLDVVDPDGSFDVGAFVSLADRVLAEHPRVIVAGGTSLYLRGLVRGLVQTGAANQEVRAQIDLIEDLHAALHAVDPVLAARLHPNDRVRLARGLEVFRTLGRRLSELQDAHAQQPDRVAVEAVWLDRADLDERIDRRVHAMIAAGYVAEVQRLLDQGYGRDLKPMLSLGYRHLCDHVIDGLELDEAIRRTQRDTRRFARKQRTWGKTLGFTRVTESHLDASEAAARRAWSP